MIDLHSHILPGIDDGPATMEASVEIGRMAVAEGVRTIVATPHFDGRFSPAPEEIVPLAGALNIQLAREKIPLAIITGAEVAISRLTDLSDEALGGLALGSGTSVLVESPYERAASSIDNSLFALQVRGFTPMLAHPERSPVFHGDLNRLRALVERGVLCSINAGSLAGEFGSTAHRFALQLMHERLVHSVASDAHDPVRRPPLLRPGFEAAERDLPGLSSQLDWFTGIAPAAILRGKPPPAAPAPPPLRKPVWRRLARSA